MANNEYELGLIRTDRGIFIDKSNYVVDPRHPDFAGGADPLGGRDATEAWTNAITFADSVGADVYGPVGTFLISGNGLRFSSNRRRLICSGKQRTIFLFRPTAHDKSCIKFQSLDSSVLYQCAVIGGCAFYSDDYTYRKRGLHLVDTSEFFSENVVVGPIGNWITTTNGLFNGTAATNGSTGIYLQGRELTTIRDCSVAADRPIAIGTNPNSAGTLDCDTLHIERPYLLSTANNAGIEFEDTGLMVQNIRISGPGACVGGKDFIRITKTLVADNASGHGGQTWADIRIDGGIRWENPTATGGYYFNGNFNTGALEGLVIDGARWGTSTTCQGVYFRRIYFIKMRDSKYYGTGGAVAIDADGSCDLLDLDYYTQPGATISMTGLTQVRMENPLQGFPLDQHTIWLKSANGQIWSKSFTDKGWSDKAVLADDATYAVSAPSNPGPTVGRLEVDVAGATTFEGAIFLFNGTTVKTPYTAPTNIAVADTDTKLCCYYTGGVLTVKNRLGESVTARIKATWV